MANVAGKMERAHGAEKRTQEISVDGDMYVKEFEESKAVDLLPGTERRLGKEKFVRPRAAGDKADAQQ